MGATSLSRGGTHRGTNLPSPASRGSGLLQRLHLDRGQEVVRDGIDLLWVRALSLDHAALVAELLREERNDTLHHQLLCCLMLLGPLHQ